MHVAMLAIEILMYLIFTVEFKLRFRSNTCTFRQEADTSGLFIAAILTGSNHNEVIESAISRLEILADERQGWKPYLATIPSNSDFKVKAEQYANVAFLDLNNEQEQVQIAIFSKGAYGRLRGFCFLPDRRATLDVKAYVPNMTKQLLTASAENLSALLSTSTSLKKEFDAINIAEEVKLGRIYTEINAVKERVSDIMETVDLCKKAIVPHMDSIIDWKDTHLCGIPW